MAANDDPETLSVVDSFIEKEKAKINIDSFIAEQLKLLESMPVEHIVTTINESQRKIEREFEGSSSRFKEAMNKWKIEINNREHELKNDIHKYKNNIMETDRQLEIINGEVEELKSVLGHELPSHHAEIKNAFYDMFNAITHTIKVIFCTIANAVKAVCNIIVSLIKSLQGIVAKWRISFLLWREDKKVKFITAKASKTHITTIDQIEKFVSEHLTTLKEKRTGAIEALNKEINEANDKRKQAHLKAEKLRSEMSKIDQQTLSLLEAKKKATEEIRQAKEDGHNILENAATEASSNLERAKIRGDKHIEEETLKAEKISIDKESESHPTLTSPRKSGAKRELRAREARGKRREINVKTRSDKIISSAHKWAEELLTTAEEQNRENENIAQSEARQILEDAQKNAANIIAISKEVNRLRLEADEIESSCENEIQKGIDKALRSKELCDEEIENKETELGKKKQAIFSDYEEYLEKLHISTRERVKEIMNTWLE
ncbi:MAG: hypothetical protein FWC91_13560 [Defluviitaleaceae bacterium]|nr:hypothetical protein [Defluviitaleaceae bacterium]